MAYSKMSDDIYISNIPSVTNENDRAIKEDKIVNAAKLLDLTAGNATGNIPIANGTVCTNLNAEKLGGNLASAFATSGHTHAAATTSSNGLMSNTDKTKLDTIATAAEVNQNAYSNILVGTTTIAADAKSDTLTLTAGSGITLTPDATNDKVTIGVTANGHTHTDATTSASGFMSVASLTKLNGIATAAEVNQNAFSNVVANGVTVAADLESDTLTLIGGSGITLTGDATNDAVTIAVTANGHTHTDATTSASGFMSPASLTKLNGIASGAEVNQNAFSNIVVGSTTIASDVESDTLTLAAGTNIALTGDATNDKVTIGVTGTVASATTATNADKVDGYDATTAPTVSTVAVRDASGDITARLIRSEYASQGSTSCAYVLVQNAMGTTASGADNYARPVALATLKTALGSMPANGGNSATATNATTAGGLAVNTTGVNNVANQIVRTNASGYIAGSYFNSTAADTTTAASSYWVETAGDGYLRPKSLASVKAELGLASLAYGKQMFTASGTFTPTTSTVWVTLSGGGGGGGSGSAKNNTDGCGGGGGGAGALYTKVPVTVTPGMSVTVTVGSGGSGGSSVSGSGAAGVAGAAGGDSSFGSYITASGGRGGGGAIVGSAGTGGTPGYSIGAGGAGGASEILSSAGGGYYGGAAANGRTYGGAGGGGGGVCDLILTSWYGGAGGAGSGSSGATATSGGAGNGYGAGGGGGGGAYNGTTGAGGAGHSGFVLVEW